MATPDSTNTPASNATKTDEKKSFRAPRSQVPGNYGRPSPAANPALRWALVALGIAIVLFLLVYTLVSCGNDDNSEAETHTETVTATHTAQPSETPTVTVTEEIEKKK